MTRFFYHQDYKRRICVICGDTNPANLSWCGTCGQFFCPKCVNRWDLRTQAMAEFKARQAGHFVGAHARALREAMRVHLS